MTKLTKSQRAARLDAFCSDENNFVAVSYNDPRAIAIREAGAQRHSRKVAAQAKREIETAAIASTFEIGQTVRASRQIGTVVAIEGTAVSVEVSGTVRKYVASFVTAA